MKGKLVTLEHWPAVLTFPFVLLLIATSLAACAPQPWEQNPDVQTARRNCTGLAEGERYACIERHAVDSLNPDVCRLAGVWVDDACLQAVYQAADDPAICDRIYLKGVRPTCRAYYTRYYQALNDHDDERAYACVSRRSLTSALFSNMGDLALYHSSYEDDPLREKIDSVQVMGIEPLPDAGNPEGVVEYKVDIDVEYETEIVSRSGHNVRFVLLEKEIETAGWRITTIGTGP